MIDSNKAESTNNYLIEQLVIARKQNEVLTEHIAELQEQIKELVAYIMEIEA